MKKKHIAPFALPEALCGSKSTNISAYGPDNVASMNFWCKGCMSIYYNPSRLEKARKAEAAKIDHKPRTFVEKGQQHA